MRNVTRALFGALAMSVSPLISASSIWINEFHYDNAGSDEGEFVELAGPVDADLTGWSLALYNGSNGAKYRSIGLAGVFADADGSGYGFLSIGAPGLQNGPDALALLDDDHAVHQFIAYENTVTAADGPAAGWISEDIGVAETAATPLGASLGLVGSGQRYEDFRWAVLGVSSPGLVNAGQSVSSVPLPGALPLFASAGLGLVALARRRTGRRANLRAVVE